MSANTNTQQSPVLVLKNVKVSYGAVRAVKDCSLSIAAGETFGLIGLNGAGKTSLIKCILGLRQQTDGAIELFGRPPHAKAARASVAYLPERFDPPWFLSGEEFVKFSLSLYGRTMKREDVVAYAERLALDPAALRRKVQTYSKGMRQKLGLIATIMSGCELLLLDEPMSGLDPRARALVKDTLVECQKAGKTIFLTSHILVDMDEICNRVAVLHSGSLLFEGAPSALKSVAQAENLERAFLHLIEKDRAA